MTIPSLFTWIDEFDPHTLPIPVLPEEDITGYGTEFDTFIDIAEAKKVYRDLPFRSDRGCAPKLIRRAALHAVGGGKPAMLFETHEVYSLRFEDRAMPEPS